MSILKFILLAIVYCASTNVAALDVDYILAAGDEIEITVYEEQDLSMKVRLGQSGLINYPYLGSIDAAGKSVEELEQHITRGLLGDILIKPSVNVSIVKYRNFYIGGEVKKSGGFPYRPGLTVRQAITIAEGLSEWGSASKVDILREGMKKPERADKDTLVRPGDTITVGEGLF